MLNKKKVLMFDWDGTLFDSAAIKEKTFSEVIYSYLSSRNHDILPKHVAEIYRKHSGEKLVDLFQRICKHYNLILLSEQDLNTMTSMITKKNETALLEAQMFPDATMLLTALKATPFKIYISASVPKEELYPLVKRNISANILPRISDIFGNDPGFTKIKDHVANILRQEQCTADACLMFSDDESDMLLSKDAGVDSVLIDRAGIHSSASWKRISSFKDVIAQL